MNLTCAQMDILISFYIENELSECLKKQVEKHLETCSKCAGKYNMFSKVVSDMKNCTTNAINKNDSHIRYDSFKTEVSAYIDNELNNEENIKIKKYTISNPQARKYLEESYNIRKMMKDSFLKTKESSKTDYSKKIIKQLELEEERILGFHPAINMLVIFTLSILVLSSIILISLSI